MTVEIEAGDSDAVEIRLAENEDFYSSVLYNPRENTVAFDRTYSGFCRDFISSRTMKVRDRGGKLFLRILLDRYSCEIFANDGEQAMTSLLFSSQECSGIRFRSKGKADISVSKYEIAVVR
jgi:beta-fructofuranosidase